jgi:hypothetical protein
MKQSVLFDKFALVEVIEVGVLHGHSAGDSLAGFKSDHASQEVKAIFIQVLSVLREWNAFPFRESWLEIGEFKGVFPVILVWGALHLEDLENLVDF